MSINLDDNTTKRLIKDLAEFDLSLPVASVYLALLKLEESGISRLESETGLHRQIIYNALARLEERGLAKHAVYNGRKRFSPEPPRRIQGLVDAKRRVAEQLVSKLELIAPMRTEQQFEVYQGDQAFIEHQMQTLTDAEEGETLCLIAGIWEKFYKTMGEEAMADYEKIRKNKKISIRYIGLETQKVTLRQAVQNRPLFDYRVLPGLDNGLINTSIWRGSVVINFFGNPVMAFVLKNPDVAHSESAFFESLWKMGTQ